MEMVVKAKMMDLIGDMLARQGSLEAQLARALSENADLKAELSRAPTVEQSG
jgi:hypothetical protein